MEKNKKIKNCFINIILIFGIVISIFPFIWMVLTSFKTMAESINVPIVIFPKKLNFDNYKEVLNILPFGNLYFNTIVSTLFRILGQMITCTLAGFAFARLDFPFKKVLFIVMLSILMIPPQLYLLPHFLIIQELGIANTILALILPGLFGAFGTFMMKQFFSTIPKEIEEAAVLEGCNYLQVFLYIFLPISKPALKTLALVVGLGSWNNLMWPLIVNNSTKKMTLSAGIASLQGQYFTNYPVLMAGAVLSCLPVIVLVYILQDEITEGLSLKEKNK